MNRVTATAMMLLVTTMFWASPAAGQMLLPGGGNAFGQHVSQMAPEHPRDHGRVFGECVSTMARTGTCPHHLSP